MVKKEKKKKKVSIHTIKKELTKLRALAEEEGKSVSDYSRYKELMIQKKELGKADRQHEVKLAKFRDVIRSKQDNREEFDMLKEWLSL